MREFSAKGFEGSTTTPYPLNTQVLPSVEVFAKVSSVGPKGAQKSFLLFELPGIELQKIIFNFLSNGGSVPDPDAAETDFSWVEFCAKVIDAFHLGQQGPPQDPSRFEVPAEPDVPSSEDESEEGEPVDPQLKPTIVGRRTRRYPSLPRKPVPYFLSFVK